MVFVLIGKVYVYCYVWSVCMFDIVFVWLLNDLKMVVYLNKIIDMFGKKGYGVGKKGYDVEKKGMVL